MGMGDRSRYGYAKRDNGKKCHLPGWEHAGSQ